MSPGTRRNFALAATLALAASAIAVPVMAQDVPYWPLWYESAVSALSTRVRDGDGPVDPSAARFDWDISRWSLAATDE